MKDKFTIKAKKEGYKARSAYKLLQLNDKYNLIKKGDKVLDLGCWPGSWLQVCWKSGCKCIGVDLRKTNLRLSNVKTYQLDVFSDKFFEVINEKFDVVLSDMAPNTSGNIEIDQFKSYELSERAFEIAKKLLKENGNFLVKIFQSDESNDLLKKMRASFKFVKSTKPVSSKKGSKEIYFMGVGFNQV